MNFKFLNIFGKKAFNPGKKIDSTVLLYTEKMKWRGYKNILDLGEFVDRNLTFIED